MSVDTGSNNIGLGVSAGSALFNGSNNVYIANKGKDESGNIRIGTRGTQKNVYVAGIYGTTIASGVTVVSDNSGHLGTVTSSARYKDNIQPMEKASEVLLDLKPVTFRYKKELDAAGVPQFGLVAEEVAKVDPDLVARDESGQPYTVRYEAVNAMLLNRVPQRASQGGRTGRGDRRDEGDDPEQAALLAKVNARIESEAAAPRLVSTGE